MKETESNNSFNNLTDDELISLINNNEVEGAEALAIQRELKLRKRVDELNSKTKKLLSSKIRKPKLLGWEFFNFNTVKIIFLFVAITVGLKILTNNYRSSKPNNYLEYNGETLALLTDFKVKTNWYQGIDGATKSVINYTVSYKNSVKGKIYSNSITLKPIIENAKLVKLYNQLEIGKDSITIKYQTTTPRNSSLSYND